VVTELGDRARAGSVAEASKQELVVLAVPWNKIGDATAGLDLVGRIVIDAKGAVAAMFEAAGFATIDLGGLADGGRLQDVGTGVFSGRNLVQLS
jgi:predicted dinucleotide-binding enzyme